MASNDLNNDELVGVHRQALARAQRVRSLAPGLAFLTAAAAAAAGGPPAAAAAAAAAAWLVADAYQFFRVIL